MNAFDRVTLILLLIVGAIASTACIAGATWFLLTSGGCGSLQEQKAKGWCFSWSDVQGATYTSCHRHRGFCRKAQHELEERYPWYQVQSDCEYR